MVKIAVEHPFTSVQKALEKKGYQAEMLNDKYDAVDYDCIVVRNQADLADFHMNVSLVEATGRTLFEIIEEVEERLVRANKISAPAKEQEKKKSGTSGGAFIAGAATGAVIGAAAGLLWTPKSGKEVQKVVKEKAASMKSSGEDGAEGGGLKEKADDAVNQVKEKANVAIGQVKEKAEMAKEKSAELKTKAKEPVDKIKAKREEKKEEKELKKQQKAVENEVKEEEKAQKAHEKAEKKVGKEIKKAKKEEGSGGMEVVEMGKVKSETDEQGKVTITSVDKDK